MTDKTTEYLNMFKKYTPQQLGGYFHKHKDRLAKELGWIISDKPITNYDLIVDTVFKNKKVSYYIKLNNGKNL